jgi:hypothetical protein
MARKRTCTLNSAVAACSGSQNHAAMVDPIRRRARPHIWLYMNIGFIYLFTALEFIVCIFVDVLALQGIVGQSVSRPCNMGSAKEKQNKIGHKGKDAAKETVKEKQRPIDSSENPKPTASSESQWPASASEGQRPVGSSEGPASHTLQSGL